jgi:hypothetical protein
MGLISEGITRVRAFEIPMGIAEAGDYAGTPRVALVEWQSVWTDKFYQAYVNGQFAGVTVDAEQRRMVVHVPSCWNCPVRIEVFGVSPAEAWMDFSEELTGYYEGRVRLRVFRSQRLPIDGRIQVYSNGGAGAINYESPISESGIWIWPTKASKGGLGMGAFGRAGFGYDLGAAVGLGVGHFGEGEFGFDADAIEWISPELAAGAYRFGVTVVDDTGRETGVTETEEVTVIPRGKPAETLELVSYEQETNELTLSIS